MANRVPEVGEFRRFPWDSYRSRWFVKKVDGHVVYLARENRPFFTDQSAITVEMWKTGMKEG